MNIWKKYLCVVFTLVMCLHLAGCGDEQPKKESIPDSMQNLVIDDSVKCDYTDFLGTWVDKDGKILMVENYNRTRYELDDANDKLLASGDLQYVEKYGFVYAYNEHDGLAHRIWFDENNQMHIDSYGTFVKMIGDLPKENVGEDGDCRILAGTWYWEGDVAKGSRIEIDSTGTIWSLYEQSGDGDWSEVDYGTIRAKGGKQFEALSDSFADVVYDLQVDTPEGFVWGGENDYYIKK